MSLHIKLYVNWRGYLRNEIIEIDDRVGKALVERNIGEIYVKPKIKKVRIKQLDELEDKMVRKSNTKKKTTARKEVKKETGKKKE